MWQLSGLESQQLRAQPWALQHLLATAVAKTITIAYTPVSLGRRLVNQQPLILVKTKKTSWVGGKYDSSAVKDTFSRTRVVDRENQVSHAVLHSPHKARGLHTSLLSPHIKLINGFVAVFTRR